MLPSGLRIAHLGRCRYFRKRACDDPHTPVPRIDRVLFHTTRRDKPTCRASRTDAFHRFCSIQPAAERRRVKEEVTSGGSKTPTRHPKAEHGPQLSTGILDRNNWCGSVPVLGSLREGGGLLVERGTEQEGGSTYDLLRS